jgi:hypothetical protein
MVAMEHHRITNSCCSTTYYALLVAALLLSVSLLLVGCGGGTTGSDGGTLVKVAGVVEDQNGAALVGVTVTALESGVSDISDQNGSFLFETPAASQIELLFESEQISLKQMISELPADTERIVGRFRINVEKQNIEVLDLEVRKRAPTARDPVASPISTARPSPGPDSAPTLARPNATARPSQRADSERPTNSPAAST